jgi:hypothetical protein
MAKLKAKDLRKLQRDQNKSDSEYLEEPINMYQQRRKVTKQEEIRRKKIRQDKERFTND